MPTPLGYIKPPRRRIIFLIETDDGAIVWRSKDEDLEKLAMLAVSPEDHRPQHGQPVPWLIQKLAEELGTDSYVIWEAPSPKGEPDPETST